MRIEWTKAVYQTHKHNAFTDLCSFAEVFLCSFREATDHMSQDGRIRIVELTENGMIVQSQQLAIANCDLRDPKLTRAADGKLYLNAYARCYDKQGNWTHSQSICWFSTTGKSWSAPRWYGERNWWIWRLGWHNESAFGIGYNRRSEALNWYQGDPLRSFECTQRSILSKNQHGLGYPNESALCFQPNGTATAIVRRDADTFSAQFGMAKPPYSNWQWKDLKVYIGGPSILLWDKQTLVISGRRWTRKGFKTAIWCLDINTAELQFITDLPSGGDNSYPGIVNKNGALYVAYYSSHESELSNIYLAKLAVDKL